MSKNSTISVIVPCYNSEKYISETLRSVVNQTYQNKEVIVIDDGSTDDSLRIIKSFDDKITWYTRPKGGACKVRNIGLKASSGEYVMFLDADDIIAPETLEALYTKLLVSKKTVAACLWSKLVYSKGNGWQKKEGLPLNPRKGQDWLQSWLTGRFIPPCSILWRRTDLKELGGWDESLTANQDGDLIMRFLLNGGDIATTQRGHAYYRQHERLGASVSNRMDEKSIKSRAQVVDKVYQVLQKQHKIGDYSDEIAQNYQSFATKAYYIGAWALGRKYEEKARRLVGRQVQKGSYSHKFLGYLLGLEYKERLVKRLNGFGFGTDREQFNSVKSDWRS